MFLMLVPVVALLVGLLLGGKPAALTGLSIRWGWLPLVALAAQWLLVRVPGTDPTPWLGAAFLASYGLLCAFLWMNRALPGLKLALVGTLLNLVVIAANGGFMPIAPDTLTQGHGTVPAVLLGQRLPHGKDVMLTRDHTVLPGLGDTLVITWPIEQALSVGDVALSTGIGLLVFIGMQPRLRRKPRRPPSLPQRYAAESAGFPTEGRPRPSAVGDQVTVE
jgi:hypothetical protein